ncbi:MAG: GNAT family N-acetyltransferase [Nevskiaceae bacterium]|nr:MAG: GNAT family N-acetyltransferase [Nevskiaceae bacterium]TBR73971.1 MAG: GNAT family N-acetyltransferase [Nevskiaceae bacterium]
MSARNLEALFMPREVAVLGAARSPGQRQLLANLAGSRRPAQRVLVGAREAEWEGVERLSQLARADLAVVFDGRILTAETFRLLAVLRCRAAIVATDVPVNPTAWRAARESGIRLLGARSAGVVRPAGPFNACAFTTLIAPGHTALIAQSRTIAAAAVDWARGRALGLAWLATTGAEADVDIADLLDYAAVDPDVHSVVIQLGRVPHGRRFMSAARAAARNKPVAVLQTHSGEELLLPSRGTDPVRSAAFARAGLIECRSLEGLFDAIAALDERRHEARRGVAVLGNGAGVCALGVDALLREGVQPFMLRDEQRRVLRARWPLVRFVAGAVDLGTLPVADVVAVAEYLLDDEHVGTVLLIRSPEPGQAHVEAAHAVLASAQLRRIVTVWLGLDSTREARALCAAQGMATFASPDAAARALRYPRQHLATQEALMQTPPLWTHFTPEAPATARIAREVSQARAPARRLALKALETYGVGRRHGSASGPAMRLRSFRHPEFGTCLAVQAEAVGLRGSEVYALPPLDAVLARRVLQAAGFGWDGVAPRTRRDVQRLAIALIRFASLVVDQPHLAALQACLNVTRDGGHCRIREALMRVDPEPLPEARRLVLAPYPVALTEHVALRDGQGCTVRAIRPEDEPAVIEMLEHTDPEAIRLRFFHLIRHFTHAMAARFSQIDYDRELGLVATDNPADRDAIVALGHLIISDDETRAEYAVLVHQDWARQGLGRHLLQRLIEYARRRGVAVVYGEVLAENTAMLGLCRSLGFTVQRDPEDSHCMNVEYVVAPDTGPRNPTQAI